MPNTLPNLGTPPAQPPKKTEWPTKDEQAFWALLVVILVGIGGVTIYAAGASYYGKGWQNLSIGLMVTGASLCVGAFFGLLFGIPRAVLQANPPSNNPTGGNPPSVARNQPQTGPNTNLQEISDWLTKILLGAGLTQLNKIPHKLGELSNYIAAGMNQSDADKAFAMTAIIFFGMSGFFAAFLWTKLYMADLLEQSAADRLRRESEERDRQLEATDQKQAQQIKAALDSIEENRKNVERMKDAVEKAAAKVMQDPLLSEHGQLRAENAPLEVAANMVLSQKEETRNANDFLILAYQNFQRENYIAGATYGEKALLAQPAQNELWKIHNLLGLNYHYQQPTDWKPGDDLTWFQKAVQNYEAAIANKNTDAEGLLSKSNLAFVYLDAHRYQECEKAATEVITDGKSQSASIVSICDLARIVAAAAKIMCQDIEGATVTLNETTNIASFEYLFNANDLPEQALKEFAALPGLKPEIAAFLKKNIPS